MMAFKPVFGAAALAILLLGGTQAAKADEDDWRGPNVVFSFGGPAYYQPPPPPPAYPYYYAPQPVYGAPPGYYAPPEHWRNHHRWDDDDED